MKLHNLLRKNDFESEYLKILAETKELEKIENDILSENFITDTAAKLTNMVKQVNDANGKKNLINSKLGQLYNKELADIKIIYNKLKTENKKYINEVFKKMGIKLEGIDISRENYLKRFCILKIAKLLIILVQKLIDDNKEELIKLLLKTLFPVITPFLELSEIKDKAEMIKNSVNTIKNMYNTFKEIEQRTSAQEAS